MAGKSRHNRDRIIVEALARGEGQTAAATLASCSVSTIRRRLDDAEFRERVERFRAEMLDSRPHVSLPIACMVEATANDAVRIGKLHFGFHVEFSEDSKVFEKLAKELAADADLLEPLDRVREALQETMKAAA